LKTVLQEGIYYVVSEGYAGNGSIHTTIEGHLASLSYSYDVCGNRITRYTNESTPGIANLRSSGGGKEKPDDSTAALNNTVDDDSSVILHPNPTDGIFTIEFTDNIDLSNAFIHIVNIDGLTIFSQKVQTEKVVIDLSVFSAGTYLVKIQSDKQNITKKLLKK
jgi:hypothetical protein